MLLIREYPVKNLKGQFKVYSNGKILDSVLRKWMTLSSKKLRSKMTLNEQLINNHLVSASPVESLLDFLSSMFCSSTMSFS